MELQLLITLIILITESLEQLPGWPQYISTQKALGPAGISLADINNDNYLEVLVGSSNGSMYVWNFKGQFIEGWPRESLGPICSKCAVGNIDPTFQGLEICITNVENSVWVLRRDGTTAPGWPQYVEYIGMFRSPVLFDIDNDQLLEIIIGQHAPPNGEVIIFNHDGTICQGWPQKLDSYCVATPSVCDIDQDGMIEICAQSFTSLYVWDKNGNIKPGWPITHNASRSSFAQPTIADFDNDGDFEIAHTYDYAPPIAKTYIGIYHHDGTNLDNWPQIYPGFQSFTTPVCADIDNDRDLEIFGGGHVSTLPGFLVRHHTGDTVHKWPVIVNNLESSPVVLDVDLNDNSLREILIADNYSHGTFYAFNHDASPVSGWSLQPGQIRVNSPSLGDIDNDGDIEIALVHSSGQVNIWTVKGAEYLPYLADWPTWFHDNWNTGWFHPKPPVLSIVVCKFYLKTT